MNGGVRSEVGEAAHTNARVEIVAFRQKPGEEVKMRALSAFEQYFRLPETRRYTIEIGIYSALGYAKTAQNFEEFYLVRLWHNPRIQLLDVEAVLDKFLASKILEASARIMVKREKAILSYDPS